MKNIYLTLLLSLFFTSNIFGQDSLYIFKAGLVNTKYSINQVDSITFSNASDSLKFNKNGYIFNKLSITNVDSIAFTAPNQKPTYTDIDGNIYTTVKIGTQTWMVENLKTTKFRTGESIPNVTDDSAWSALTTAAYSNYDNNSSIGDTYGRLYNWHAASDSRNIAPAGWHVPTAQEWTILKDYLIANSYNYDGGLVDNKIAKALASKSLWKFSTTAGAPGNNQSLNNTSGFNAQPVGFRYGTSGVFYSNTEGSYFWANTEDTDVEAQYRAIFYGYNWFGEFVSLKRLGLSIRCIKSDLATLRTNPINTITSSSAISGGEISFDGHDPILERGLCWDTVVNPTILKNLTIEGTGVGYFTSHLTKLLPGRLYFVRAYATNTVGTAYGDQLSFTTLKTKPVVDIMNYTELTYNSVKTGGIIISNGGAQITAKGICWSKNPIPVLNIDSMSSNGTGSGQFESIIMNLQPNTRYYIRAYATNSEGTSYSNVIGITTLITKPEVSTYPVSIVTRTTAQSGGIIISNGGDSIISKGVCWGVNPNPEIQSDSITIDGSGSNSFTSLLSGLTPATTYYLRAYATNSDGTSYGDDVNFMTLTTIPTVITSTISTITSTTAIGGATITTNGGEEIIAKGICWSTNHNPKIETDSLSNDGNGSDSFVSTIRNLKPATTYYVKAYATNINGTAYGDEVEFTTLSTTPTINTSIITLVTTTTAVSGGEIQFDGGAAIIEKGVCWSLSENPKIETDAKTMEGTGSGIFTSHISGLLPETTYFVRAYATNSEGTSYGNNQTFTTLIAVP